MSGKGKERDEISRSAIKRRVAKEEHAFRMVEKMVLNDAVDKQFFLDAGKFITISQYKDVVEERGIAKLCGYPLCNNPLTQVLKQKYKISLREKKVYDITERKNFCCNICYKASKYYESQLLAEPVWMRENEKQFAELKLFDESNEPRQRLSGSGEEIVSIAKFSQCSSCDTVEENISKELSIGETIKLAAQENVGKDSVGINDVPIRKDGDGDQEDDDLVVGNFNHVIQHFHDVNIVDEAMHIDYESRDDCQDITSRISCNRKCFPGQKTSQNLETSSSQREIVEGKVCQKPGELYFDKTSTSFPSETKHRSGNSLIQVTDSKERMNSDPCNTQRYISGDSKEDEKQGEQIVNSRQMACDETSQMSNEVRLESSIGSEIYSNVKIDSGDHRVSSRLENSLGNNHEALKQKYEAVYETLLEWCSPDTRSYCMKCCWSESGVMETKDFTFSRAENSNQVARQCDSDDEESDTLNMETIKQENMRSGAKDILGTVGETDVGKTLKKKPIIPFIDSVNLMSIRGKIVSEKLTKALFPMLSRVGLCFADVSRDMTNILKTLRFTSTNIVLKPLQWTFIALTLLLTLMRCNAALREMLCSRQNDLHSLLNDVAISEHDLNRLVGVFISEGTALYESSIGPDFPHHREFDMEQLD